MARYLLDASVAIAAASGAPATLDRLSRLSIGEVAISAVAYAELLAGVAAAGKDGRLAENIALIAGNIDILPFDRAAAEIYGRLLRGIEPKRRRTLDRMVAAQALALGLTLVTRDAGHFDDVPDLRLEVWPG
ncbi:PIN domain-containing protein [Methylocystis sp. WRRC1]|uniref:PIN domain-containing protein n=1 Tax=Methylocystis sp. WRRC1 TaxID=1732014 RepID=UPI001D156AEA|nr:PIN domain-containing protein [Methylocystis sp. WRRC1]